jgi:hypothetical protein
MIDDLSREQAIAWLTVLGWVPMDDEGKTRDRAKSVTISPFLVSGGTAMWVYEGRVVTASRQAFTRILPCSWDAFRTDELRAILRWLEQAS